MIGRVYQNIFGNFATKLAAVFIAIVLWAIVLFSNSVEITKDVPIQIITSPELVVSNELPDHVAFQLTGPKVFRRMVEDRAEPPIRINLAGLKPGMITRSVPRDEDRWPPGMRVDATNPAVLRIRLETLRYTTVKVKADVRGEPEKGFRIVKAEIHPAMIPIKGPRAQISALTELVSNPVDISGLKHSLKQPLTFETTHLGVDVEGSPPVLSLEVAPFSPNFRLRNVALRVLGSTRYKIRERMVTVFVRASPEDLKNLDHSQVFAEIDVRGRKIGQYEAHVRVTAPKTLSVIRVVPETVEVTLY